MTLLPGTMTRPIELLELPPWTTEAVLAAMFREGGEAEMRFRGIPVWLLVAAAVVGVKEGMVKRGLLSEDDDPSTSVEVLAYHRAEEALYIVASVALPGAGEDSEFDQVLGGSVVRLQPDDGSIEVYPTTLETARKILELTDALDLWKAAGMADPFEDSAS